jgi:hypothetical protein
VAKPTNKTLYIDQNLRFNESRIEFNRYKYPDNGFYQFDIAATMVMSGKSRTKVVNIDMNRAPKSVKTKGALVKATVSTAADKAA